MAVNWCELDALIAEWDLEGAQVQKIKGSYPGEVFISFHRPGGKGTLTLMLRCSGALAQILAVPKAPPSTGALQRFPALLRARIAGSRVLSLKQLGRERILVFRLQGGKGAYNLIVRLWAQRANAYLEAEDGTVVDVLIRRRNYGEVPKMRFLHEVPEHYEDDGRVVRPCGELSLNEMLLRDVYGGGEAGEQALEDGAALPAPPLKERQKKKTSNTPWRVFSYKGFVIWVGRHSRDNDALLRAAKSYDPWLHARDWQGPHVVVRTKPGKTVPLDVLLMAARLALYYSKGRSAGSGDVYYTRIKYLKRIKASIGKVIPTQEENLFVKWDPNEHPLGKEARTLDDAGSL